MNVYAFTGNLGREAEVRHTSGGTAVCSFSVAVSSGYGDNEKTSWINCSLWGKRAEGKLPGYLVTGQKVAITGELTVREYEDRDGNKRTSVDVNVNTLDLIGQKAESGDQDRGGFPSSGGTQAPKKEDPFAEAPDFGDVPVDDDIPF